MNDVNIAIYLHISADWAVRQTYMFPRNAIWNICIFVGLYDVAVMLPLKACSSWSSAILNNSNNNNSIITTI